MKYLIGIDGGGTHSRLLAVSLDGKVVGRSRYKSTNVESNSISVVKQHFVQLLRDFSERHQVSLSDCAALCFGTAGVDTHASKRAIEAMVDSLNFACPVKVVNDAVIALYASTRGKPGIMLIAGTGSIGYGCNEQRQTWRVGGFGYIVGDEGSAYWVAREGVRQALKAYDHSGPETRLIYDFCKALGLKEFDEIVDYVYQKNKSELARLSHVVTHAQAAGDPVAADIMNRVLDALVDTVMTVVRELDMGGDCYPLLLGGGFLLNCKWLRLSLAERVAQHYPLLSIGKLDTEAEYGAVRMAADMIGASLPESLE